MVQNQNIMRVQNASAPLLQGAFAGFIGTVPMTIFMLVMHRLLPKWQQFALPPEQISDELEDRADVKKHMDKPQRVGAALVAHFGYGMSMGVIYTFLLRRVPLPAALKGTVFALAVWAGSYLGWLPIAGFSASGTEQPLRRNILMIAAHVVWGSVTAVVADLLMT